jgi:hypothetical protein
MFDLAWKPSNFLLEIMTLVSTNNTSSDKVFIVVGRSFTYIVKSKGAGIDPYEPPCFIIPQFVKKS